MANILYGVNGEGAGHSTRAKEVISHLQQRGHAVQIVSFDRGLATFESPPCSQRTRTRLQAQRSADPSLRSG